MLIQICVGSSCHLKGSPEIVELFQKAVAEKHLEDEIWELRPLRDRILFAAWTGDGFVLLHHFMKQTQKTPRREIEQAKRELVDFKQRSEGNA